jgi:cyanophycin synthetase
MPLELRDLRALEGPNLYYPQPAVKLQLRADRDVRREIADAVKTWAQQVGVVIGQLQQDLERVDDGLLITTTWLTPLPNTGERIAEGAFRDLEAAERGDGEYSHDEMLWAAIRERKREEPSLEQLQLFAEAHARELPFLPRGDGSIMVGSGSRGYVFDPSVLALGMEVSVPWDAVGAIPIVAVTGTNGKTTTTRLIAHVMAHAGRRVGRTDTDGITIDGEMVDEGDWAGWGGGRRVLTDPRVDVAVLETSRGGMLRRGLGFSACDVSVVTNVSADHLGEFGIDTIEDLAHVKSLIVRVTKPDGRAVLNADDPLVLRMRALTLAPVVLYSRDSGNAALIDHAESGGDTVRSDGQRIEVAVGGVRGGIALADVPLTFGGAARHNVENVMAAIGACATLGVDLSTIAAALRSFESDAAHNANRLNIFRRGGEVVVFDYAHNEAGLRALLHFSASLPRPAGGRLLLVLGGPGDRTDTQMLTMGRLAGAQTDRLLLHEEERYLRGRPPGETTALYRQGALEGGMRDDQIAMYSDEVAALESALAELQPGDVLLIAAHAQRAAMLEHLDRWQREG